MLNNLCLASILILPLHALAGDSDTSQLQSKLSHNQYPNEKILTTKPEYPSSVASENIKLFSTAITPFIENKIPVDYDLFKCHVNSLDNEIQMDYNHLVKSQIDFFGTRWQSKLKQMITKSAYYFPIYEEILSAYEIPTELKYLSIIESGLNPFAGSRAGAVGPWQFMPATARIFDLTINNSVDERRSIEKSTHAACNYLKQMHNQYGDWLVALAAYNCGPGNVRKAMRYSGKKDFWGIYDYLPRETQNYVPKFIAMSYLMNFYEEYGILPAPIDDMDLESTSVYCKKGLDLSIIAQNIDIEYARLLKLNPEIKSANKPFKTDKILTIPQDKYDLFYACQEEITSESEYRAEQIRLEEANRPKPRYYTVKRGDCLPIIAKKFGITVRQLKSWNHIKGSLIYPNQRLIISI